MSKNILMKSLFIFINFNIFIMLRSRGTSVAQFIEEQNNKFLFTNQRLRAHLASDQPLCHELPSLSSRTVNKNRTLKISTRIYDKYLLNG
jgi:hypothetical protein